MEVPGKPPRNDGTRKYPVSLLAMTGGAMTGRAMTGRAATGRAMTQRAMTVRPTVIANHATGIGFG